MQPATSVEELRSRFLKLLDQRRFAACEALLEVTAHGSKPTLTQACRHYRAILLSAQRKHDQAEAMLRQLLKEELLPVQRSRSLLELAIQLDELGRWHEAEPLYKETIQHYEARQDALGAAKARNNLGICIAFQVEQQVCAPERLTEAIDLHKRALAVARKHGAELEAARNFHGLGKAYALQGKPRPAEEAFRTFIDYCRDEDDKHGLGFGLSDLADALLRADRAPVRAKELLDEAIEHLAHSDDLLDLAEAHTRRGRALLRLGDEQSAEKDLLQAVKLAESLQIQFEAATARASHRATIDAIYLAPVSYYLDQGRFPAALSAAERARSRTLTDLLTDLVAQTDATPQRALDPEVAAQRRQIRQSLDHALATGAPTETLIQELQEIEQSIELLAPTSGSFIRLDALTSAEICARLPPDAGLIMYQEDAQQRMWAFIVTRNTLTAKRLASPARRWLEQFLASVIDGERSGFLVPDMQSGRLRTPHFWGDFHHYYVEPLADLCTEVETLYICPAASLHSIPLAMLGPDAWAKPTLASGARRIIYGPSATTLFALGRPHTRKATKRMLAIAPTAPELEFTAGAACSITSGVQDGVLAKQLATRARIAASAGDYRIVCFFGHARFNERYPMLAGLQCSDGMLHAADIPHLLHLNCDVIILAACESGRAQVLRGEEIFGLSRALFLAGARAVIVTLWPVHEVPTRLLIERVGHYLLDQSELAALEPASALLAAQEWLRTLAFSEAVAHVACWREVATEAAAADRIEALAQRMQDRAAFGEDQPFRHPHYWASFVLIGDPSLGLG